MTDVYGKLIRNGQVICPSHAPRGEVIFLPAEIQRVISLEGSISQLRFYDWLIFIQWVQRLAEYSLSPRSERIRSAPPCEHRRLLLLRVPKQAL